MTVASGRAISGAAARYFRGSAEFGRGTVSQPRAAATPKSLLRLAFTNPSDAQHCHWALNTATHPCAQLTPLKL
jgi:hypothetical protein